MKKCPYCGSNLADEAKFCLYCMKELKDKKIAPTKKHVPKIVFTIIVAALVLSMCAVAAVAIVPQFIKPPAPVPETEELTEAEKNVVMVGNTDPVTTEKETSYITDTAAGVTNGTTTDAPSVTGTEKVVVTEPPTSAMTEAETAAATTAVVTDAPVPDHTHNFVHWITVTEPTCTKVGKEIEICYICEEKREKTIPATGRTANHTYGTWTTVKQPTCIETGTEERVCSGCGEKETRSIAAKGHTVVSLEPIAATCTTAGKSEGSRCSVCGQAIKAQTTVAALGHNYGAYQQTKAPTCTETGTEQRTCSRCGEKETKTVAAKGHSYSEWVVTKKPTLTSQGTETRTCSVCGNKETRTVTVYNNAKVGDYIVFGSYEQDNNTSNGKEDIEWLVLAKEGTKMLVISRYALDCQPYNTTYTIVTWETCTLRTWLNGTFFKNAFTSDEQKVIQSTTVTPDTNSSYFTPPGKYTTDKVFLLSITEANKYFSSNEARKCAPTAYAIAKGTYADDYYSTGGKATCCWWLRSRGLNSYTAAYVYGGGFVGDSGDGADVDSNGVRPAVWIELGA